MTWRKGSLLAAAVALALAAGCRKNDAAPAPPESGPVPEAGIPAGPESDDAAPSDVAIEEAAGEPEAEAPPEPALSPEDRALAKVEACSRAGGEDCLESLPPEEQAMALRASCLRMGGTKCDLPHQSIQAAADAECRERGGKPCAELSDVERWEALTMALGVPERCRRQVRIEEQDGRLRLPVSLSRNAPRPAVKVEIQTDAVYAHDRRVAGILEQDGVRLIDPAAKPNGAASRLVEPLAIEVRQWQTDLEALEERGDRTFPYKSWMLIGADVATPFGIVADAAYSAAAGGANRLAFATCRVEAARSGACGLGPLRGCAEEAEIRFGMQQFGGAEPAGPEAGKIGLTARLTATGTEISVSTAFAEALLPAATTGGEAGRVLVANVERTADEIRRFPMCATRDGFDHCAYVAYLGEYVARAGDGPVPDLLKIHEVLLGISDRIAALEPLPVDRWLLSIRPDADVPIVRVIAVADFARFRTFGFDWTVDAEFRARVEDWTGAEGPDPSVEVPAWPDAIRAEALFPRAVLLLERSAAD